MQQNKYYKEFAAHFATKSTSELVDVFNRETQHNGWASIRAYHDRALIDEFIRRGIEVSAINNGKSISLANPIIYDEATKALVIDTNQ